MTTSVPATAVRFAARATVPFYAVGLALLAVPAHAEAAEGWGSAGDVDALHALLLLVGLPFLLFVLIGLAVYIPAIVRGEDVSPTGAAPENQWLGGPRADVKELAAGDAEPSETGGARGNW